MSQRCSSRRTRVDEQQRCQGASLRRNAHNALLHIHNHDKALHLRQQLHHTLLYHALNGHFNPLALQLSANSSTNTNGSVIMIGEEYIAILKEIETKASVVHLEGESETAR